MGHPAFALRPRSINAHWSTIISPPGTVGEISGGGGASPKFIVPATASVDTMPTFAARTPAAYTSLSGELQPRDAFVYQ